MMDNRTFIIAGIVIALAVGGLAVFLASSNPDGLESTALMVQGQKTLTGDTPQDAEVQEPEAAISYNAPLPDYTLEGYGKGGDLLAILVGTLLAVLVAIGAVKLLMMVRKTDRQD